MKEIYCLCFCVCLSAFLFFYFCRGFDGTTAETEWGPEVADDDRCKPSELLYNCESLARSPRSNERIRVVLPANLKCVVGVVAAAVVVGVGLATMNCSVSLLCLLSIWILENFDILSRRVRYHRDFTATADIIAESYRRSRVRHGGADLLDVSWTNKKNIECCC